MSENVMVLRAWVPGISLSIALAGACSGAGEPAKAGKDGTPAAPVANAGGPALIGAPAAVDGVATWAENREAGVTVSVPTGDDWSAEKTGNNVSVHSEKLGVTIMLQHQSGIESDRLEEFLALIVESNKRDAPKYSARPTEKGSLAGHPAARLDGEFDNGKAYATRDYVVIGPKGATALMVRGPKTDAARVQAIADHVAATFVP